MELRRGSYANAAAGVTFNAKGGVYESSGLSKYVNGVYDTPQYFTFRGASKFAKGGVFAEAGEEAIMPLTRDSAGRLGVRAQGLVILDIKSTWISMSITKATLPQIQTEMVTRLLGRWPIALSFMFPMGFGLRLKTMAL